MELLGSAVSEQKEEEVTQRQAHGGAEMDRGSGGDWATGRARPDSMTAEDSTIRDGKCKHNVPI